MKTRGPLVKKESQIVSFFADMDTKVKSMIKLIEEDADSFARRAEMYYKKRPELMKLVEEFYRAYRALAERYDYATGELRHAQRTLQAAFPDQVHFSLQEELASSISTTQSHPMIKIMNLLASRSSKLRFSRKPNGRIKPNMKLRS